jgi:hypothetical protein
MNAIKINKPKDLRKMLVLITLVAIVFLLALSVFTEDKDLKSTLYAVSSALLAALFSTGVFKKSFGNKNKLNETE